MGNKICQNQNIIGVQIMNVHKKCEQYADDIWASILNEQHVFDALLDTFDHFREFSGLKINYDKTQILRIGSLRKSDAKLRTQKPTNWTRKAKILGIDIHTDVSEMIKYRQSSTQNKSNRRLLEKQRFNCYR